MSANGLRVDESEKISNRHEWRMLRRHLVEAESVYVKIFGGVLIRVDDKYRIDLVIWFGTMDPETQRCPHYSFVSTTLYINTMW